MKILYGSLSSSFTVKGQVVLADKNYVKQITNVLKKAGIELDGIVSNVLAERQVILDKNELKDNVMILDIGAGNTDIGVFNGESFIYNNTIPLGGDNITSDIAYVFNISDEEADRLKKQYGLALKSFIDNDTDIILNTYKGEERTNVTRAPLANCFHLESLINVLLKLSITLLKVKGFACVSNCSGESDCVNVFSDIDDAVCA